ncbi:hypothetical protein HD806DRAFT_474259 [Xylariaceae sp. AK1471]|nr:hypothetical protein HD806DRAFT_474259 [Xylariaceae sp. AK1471]
MASVEVPAVHVDVLPPVNKAVRCDPSRLDVPRPISPRSDTDDEDADTIARPPRDTDSISIASTESFPDFTGRRLLTFDDERTTTAYEAWELSFIEDRNMRQSWKSFCGINFGTRWVNRNDGCVLINPITSFEQGELADLHEDAIQGYRYIHGRQETTYEQDLANRAYKLPDDIYDKLQHLIEDKTTSTNRNPYRKREWRVVVLQPDEFQMTELLPERKRKSFFSRKKQPPAARTWFVVLRGQEVKSTKEDGGWKAYNRHSNPWWRLDNRETKEERDQHKDFVKKMDNRHYGRYRVERPRPVNPYPPARRASMSMA